MSKEEGRITTAYDCSMIEIFKHEHELGNITVIENSKEVPFDVKRVFYMYDVPAGESRGAHAHKTASQFIVAATGCFTVTISDGDVKRKFTLNRPFQGLYVKPGLWCTLDEFSSGSVCLVLTDKSYSPEDYIREYDDFLKFKNKELKND